MTIANPPAASGYMSAKLPIRRGWPGAIHIRDGRPYPPDLRGPRSVGLERLAVSQHGTQRQRRSQGAGASLSSPSQTWPAAPTTTGDEATDLAEQIGGSARAYANLGRSHSVRTDLNRSGETGASGDSGAVHSGNRSASAALAACQSWGRPARHLVSSGREWVPVLRKIALRWSLTV